MHKYLNGLDATAIRFAVRQTGERVFLVALISCVLSIVIMQNAIGRVHIVGIVLAVAMPVMLSTPTTFFMCLKHQQLRAANKKLQELATIDCLTGVLNRRAFCDKVKQWLATTRSGALMMIDVDRFKHVNDTFGHDVGDKTLQVLIAQIGAVLPENALIGRIGGEEFAVFLPQSKTADATDHATQICRTVNQTDFSPAGLTIPLSVSLGVAIAGHDADLRQLMREADSKMYRAKNEGRNRVICNEENLTSTRTAA